MPGDGKWCGRADGDDEAKVEAMNDECEEKNEDPATTSTLS